MEKEQNHQSDIIKKKIINKIEITNEEINKIKSICDYLFVDRVKNFSTFPRFEKCFVLYFPMKMISSFQKSSKKFVEKIKNI